MNLPLIVAGHSTVFKILELRVLNFILPLAQYHHFGFHFCRLCFPPTFSKRF
jgi:hypothetical protein